MNNKETILAQTYKFAKEYHSKDCSGHDFEHIRRVYANMNKLLASEPDANAFICKMSALLHDVDDHKLNTDGHVAERFLKKLNLDEETIGTILNTIKAISFSKSGARPKFETLEMKLLSDADKLDAMGAMGICRTFAYGGSKQRPIFDKDTFPGVENGNSHSINHFFEKLLLLKGAMQTKAGQEAAKERHNFMVTYLEHFFEEQDLPEWSKYLEDFLKRHDNNNSVLLTAMRNSSLQK